MGIEDLEAQLQELGYETWRLPPNFVAFKFLIPHGRFRGKQVTIALQGPQFPQIPPSGPHLAPHLLPFNNTRGPHPDHGIHDRMLPSPEFQYWSRPFVRWNQSTMTAGAYLAFLRTLFDFE